MKAKQDEAEEQKRKQAELARKQKEEQQALKQKKREAETADKKLKEEASKKVEGQTQKQTTRQVYQKKPVSDEN